jgi:uncharacterized protein
MPSGASISVAAPRGRHLLRDNAMLELRPNCECCDRDLPPDSHDARICSFECTLLHRLRGQNAPRYLPQLRGRAGDAPYPATRETGRQPVVYAPHLEAGRLRRHCEINAVSAIGQEISIKSIFLS